MLRRGQAQVIRHTHFVEGMPIRRIAREMKMSRNTVRKYLLGDGEPKCEDGQGRAAPVREGAASRIEGVLEEWSGRGEDGTVSIIVALPASVWVEKRPLSIAREKPIFADLAA
jgi:predicted transcriptional regulator